MSPARDQGDSSRPRIALILTGQASYTYLPDPSGSVFLVLEMGSDGTEGLVGHYGR